MEIRLPNINKVIVTGRLTRDPELRFSQNNLAIMRLSLAANRNIKKQDGWTQETTFLNCVIFGNLAESISERAKKGSAVMVEGRLSSRSWEDSNTGAKRSAVEIVVEKIQVLDKGSFGNTGSSSGNMSSDFGKDINNNNFDEDDDIPF